MDMVTRAMDSPRGSCWPNSSVPCDPGIQPCSVPVAAQPRSASPSRTGRGRLGRHRASSAPGYHWATGLHLILLSSSLTHTHIHTPPRRHLVETQRHPLPAHPLSLPPPSTGCFKQGWAEQIRLMPWETLPRPEPFSSWAIPGLEVARKRK